MNARKILGVAVVVGVVAALSGGCTSDGSDGASAPTAVGGNGEVRTGPAPRTIAEVAATNPDLVSFTTALSATELAQTLAGEGPYTVFVPTNDGLVLPAGTVDPATAAEQLADILAYHVVEGVLLVDDLKSGTLTTLNGSTITVSRDGDTVEVTDARGNTSRVVQADVDAENGVIHVIDGVLLPPER